MAGPRLTLLITGGHVGGGAERQVHDLALSMSERGWDTDVVSMLSECRAYADLPAAGVPVRHLGMTRGRPDPRAVLRLAAHLRRRRTDVVHAHMIHANLLARVTRMIYPAPVVVSTIHSQNEGGGWRTVAYRLTDRLGSITTADGSAALAAAIARRSVPEPRGRYLPNGVAHRQYLPDPQTRVDTRAEFGLSGRFTWLCAGRMVEAKDHATLLAGFRRVVDVEPAAMLLLAGAGPLEDHTKAQAHRLRLTGNLRFLGYRSDLPRLLQAADAFVLSSAWEGLPIVVLEAAATALPIVMTQVGGSDDVIARDNGWVVPVRDPAALGEAMIRMMRLPHQLRFEMGRRGADLIAEQFSLDAVADSWAELYRRLLKSSAVRRQADSACSS
jgi:glycosyltransferase involved in cell wall biosynthesis